MEIFSLVLLVLYVVSTLPVYVVAENAVDASTASTLIKEGQSAEILCMAKGTGDFFWRKGESLLNSSLVASFTGGQVRKDAEPYVVTENGTLIIKIVTLGDEGKYFCRVSSVINECYGELNVFVEASLRSFVLAIDRCDRESSCLLYISPTQSTTLTCTATDASPSMTLKWFNGSTEITEGIEKYDLPTQNGNAREIRSTITTVYGHPASLTCQAVDPKRGNNDVRFAHAQVETTVPVTATLQSWIIVAITLAGCLIVFGIYKLIKAMANRTQNKKYKKLKTQTHQSLQEEAKTNEEAINLKHKELTEVKVSAESKDSEISELKGKLRQTEEELKKSRNENIELQTKVAKDNAHITSAEENLASKAKSITELETKLKRREEEIKNAKEENFELQKRIANNEAKMTAAEVLAKTKDQEIKKKDQELTDLKSKVPDQIQEMSTLKEDVRSKAKAITELECKVKQKEAEVKEKTNEIFKLQKNNSDAFAKEKSRIALAKNLVQTKANEITELKDKLRQQEEEIQKERNANVQLQNTIVTANGKITVAEKLAHRGDKELTELKKKVEQKDKEIKHEQIKFIECQMKLQKNETDIEEKNVKIFELEAIVNENNIRLRDNSKELADLKEELTKLEELYKNLRGAQKGSQKKPGKKHHGK